MKRTKKEAQKKNRGWSEKKDRCSGNRHSCHRVIVLVFGSQFSFFFLFCPPFSWRPLRSTPFSAKNKERGVLHCRPPHISLSYSRSPPQWRPQPTVPRNKDEVHSAERRRRRHRRVEGQEGMYRTSLPSRSEKCELTKSGENKSRLQHRKKRCSTVFSNRRGGFRGRPSWNKYFSSRLYSSQRTWKGQAQKGIEKTAPDLSTALLPVTFLFFFFSVDNNAQQTRNNTRDDTNGRNRKGEKKRGRYGGGVHKHTPHQSKPPHRYSKTRQAEDTGASSSKQMKEN